MVVVFLIGDYIHSNDVPFASPHDNMAGIARVVYEEALCHVLSAYPWLVFCDSVHGSALGVGYSHGSEIPVFSFDILSPSDTEHRRVVQSRVVKLPDLLDPFVKSLSCAVVAAGHAFH